MPGLTRRLSHPGEASNNSQMEPCIRLLESGGAGETGATMLVLLLLIVGVLLLDVGALVLVVGALRCRFISSPPPHWWFSNRRCSYSPPLSRGSRGERTHGFAGSWRPSFLRVSMCTRTAFSCSMCNGLMCFLYINLIFFV
jgi:hypothetical protein